MFRFPGDFVWARQRFGLDDKPGVFLYWLGDTAVMRHHRTLHPSCMDTGMTHRAHGTARMLLLGLAVCGSACAVESPPVTIRTESYPRPPYSEATYHVYERAGKVICTKLKICDKYEHCDVDYHAGAFLDPLDQRTGDPYGVTVAVVIPPGKRGKAPVPGEVRARRALALPIKGWEP